MTFPSEAILIGYNSATMEDGNLAHDCVQAMPIQAETQYWKKQGAAEIDLSEAGSPHGRELSI